MKIRLAAKFVLDFKKALRFKNSYRSIEKSKSNILLYPFDSLLSSNFAIAPKSNAVNIFRE